MGELVNLRRARKARARAADEAQAVENRRKFGRTRAEREALDAEATLVASRLDAHKVDGPDKG